MGVVTSDKRKVGVQLVSLRNVQRKFVGYRTFQVFGLGRSRAASQLAFDVVRTALDKRRRFFVLNDSADEQTNRFARTGFGRRGKGRIVENDSLCSNRLNARVAHIISEGRSRSIAANEDPKARNQARQGRKVGGGSDKRRNARRNSHRNIAACEPEADGLKLRSGGRGGFVNKRFINDNRSSGRRSDGFKAVVRRIAETACVNQLKRSKCVKARSGGVGLRSGGNAGKRNSRSVKRLCVRQFARIGEKEALKQARKVRLRKVDIETARSVKVGNRTFLVLPRRVNRRTRDGRKFAAEIRIAVGFQPVPNGRTRKRFQRRFFRECKAGNVRINFIAHLGYSLIKNQGDSLH